jgi:hypothetical protein
VIRYWIGLRRLRRGYCPACNSSPLTPRCEVCQGERRYGRELDAYLHDVWLRRWREGVGR